MNETEEQAAPASEDVAVNMDETQSQDEKPARQVPLEALEKERKKRQEAEVQVRLYEELAKRAKEAQAAPEENPEDDEELVNRGDLRQFHKKLTSQEFQAIKREVAEETFKESRPEAIQLVNSHLKEILEKKPWLADSIENAPNRYARAYEIVQDYMPQVIAKNTKSSEAKKIVENASKPGSPAAAGKSQNLNSADYLRSIAGTKEFGEYRKKLLGR